MLINKNKEGWTSFIKNIYCIKNIVHIILSHLQQPPQEHCSGHAAGTVTICSSLTALSGPRDTKGGNWHIHRK